MRKIPRDLIEKSIKIAQGGPERSEGSICFGMYHERLRCAELVRQIRFMDEFDREALISAIMEPSDEPKNKDQWASESGE